jgi:peptide/nickel transport system ATP-binding protein
MVCDEITSALDVSVQALLVEQLRQMQSDGGLSMVFITHNLAVVVEHGPVDQVLDHPAHEYTQRLLADLPSTE